MSQAGIVISMAEVTLSSSAFYPLVIRVLPSHHPRFTPSSSAFYPHPRFTLSSAFYPLIRVLYPLISPSAIRPASVSVFYPNP